MQFDVISLESMKAVHHCYLKSQCVDIRQCCCINMNCSDRLWELCTFFKVCSCRPLDDMVEVLLLRDSYLIAVVSVCTVIS